MLKEDGTVKPEAEAVLRDLEGMCGWMSAAVPLDNNGATDPYRAVAALEKRGIFAEVKKRLFADLTQLKRKVEHD